jgi:flagellar biosynthesis protein FliR
MSQLPVFFFGLPVQIAVQIRVMMLTISGIMGSFLNGFTVTLRRRLGI